MVLDTETTGLDPAAGGVVEYAHTVVQCGPPAHEEAGARYSVLTHPGVTVPPEARAVHHISDADVEYCRPAAAELADLRWERVDAFCAHNATFDRGFIGGMLPAGVPWLDTLRLAKHLWPLAPAYGNQVLRYWLDVGVDLPVGLAPHRALYDAVCTAAILVRMLTERPLATLLTLSATPVLLEVCAMPAHRGVPWAEVPAGYLRWMLSRGGWDEDTAHTVRHYLGLPA